MELTPDHINTGASSIACKSNHCRQHAHRPPRSTAGKENFQFVLRRPTLSDRGCTMQGDRLSVTICCHCHPLNQASMTPADTQQCKSGNARSAVGLGHVISSLCASVSPSVKWQEEHCPCRGS